VFNRFTYLDRAFAVFLFLLLATTPLYRGGNALFPILGAALCGCVLFALAAIRRWRVQHENADATAAFMALIGALGLLAALGLLGAIPLPTAAWSELAGRGNYVFADGTAQDTAYRLSFAPRSSLISALHAIAALGIVVSAFTLPRRLLLAVIGALALVATLQSVLGLVQVALRSPASLVYEGAYQGIHRAVGTFVNKNHFATFLAMLLPIMLLRCFGRIVFFAERRGVKPSPLSNFWWCAATAVVAFALLGTLSRAGLAAASLAVAIVLVAIAFSSMRQLKRWMIYAAATVAVVALVVVGLSAIGENLSTEALASAASGRAEINRSTLAAAMSFFPWGSGLGSFVLVFPRFQSHEFAGFVDHAHNDYLQLLLEAGLVGLVVVALIVIAGVLALRTVWLNRAKWHQASWLVAIALGAGCSAFAFHAAFDFPAHIPGVALLAVFLFSAFIVEASASQSSDPKQSREGQLD
jgi:O-antigen ligase